MAAPPDTGIRNRSLEERVNRLEGVVEHMATKADVERVLAAVERVRTESRVGIERNRAEIQRNRADIIKIMVRLAGVVMALMALGFAFLRFTGTG